MPNGRITITLDLSEKSALYTLSTNERRDPRAQAAVLIRQALEQLGLLQPVQPSPQEVPNVTAN